MKLTDANVAALKMPPGKTEHFEWCERQPGYGVRLRGSGDKVSKTLTVQYRVNGKTRRESIGDSRQITVETGRKIAQKRLGAVADGKDPAAERAAAKAEAAKQIRTLGKVVDQYLDVMETDNKLRPSSLTAAKRYLRKHFEPLHAIPIHEITRADIAATLRTLSKEHGRTSASRARTNLSALFAWSIGEGYTETNMVTGTNDPDEPYKPRDRTLSDDELRIIWTNLEDDTFGHVMKLLILTGCRRNEIGDLQYSEIDMATGIMTLPPERTKQDAELVLTLPPSAMEILRSIPKNKYRDDFIFGKQGKRGFNAWSWCTMALNARIAAKTGKALEPWTLHDLRRTMRSGLGSLDIPPYVAERCIGHLPPKIHRAYDTYDYQPDITRALRRWADHVDAIVEGRQSNVISMKAAAN